MAFLASLIDAVTERGRLLLTSRVPTAAAGMTATGLAILADRLLSVRGEASGTMLARQILDGYAGADSTIRLEFLRRLAEAFGPDEVRFQNALEAYRRTSSGATVRALHDATEPRRQELIRRLNHAPGATQDLVRMREDVLDAMRSRQPLDVLDRDFTHLFSSWFNRGFLVLHRVDWSTPANILEKVIRYEAVHEIRDWADLRRRLEPSDRRCFAFFHPRLADEPLIYVEVALTREIPSAIGPLLDAERVPIIASEATTAVFYSISNCQRGLAGISFGNLLIKQVVHELRQELPKLKTFITLSPVPGFCNWLDRECRTENSAFLKPSDKRCLDGIGSLDGLGQKSVDDEIKRVLLELAATYFLRTKTTSGRPVDPVARFHLGNGACLERINWMGDPSHKGLKQAAGLMVNYLYDLDVIVENHEAFASHGAVQASKAVRQLERAGRGSGKLIRATLLGG